MHCLINLVRTIDGSPIRLRVVQISMNCIRVKKKNVKLNQNNGIENDVMPMLKLTWSVWCYNTELKWRLHNSSIPSPLEFLSRWLKWEVH